LSSRATEGVSVRSQIEDPLIPVTPETRATLPEQKGLSSTPIAQTIAAVPDSGILASRYSINSLSDIKKLREGLPATPANLDAASQKLWNEYLSYYEKRLNKIEAELTQGSISSNPPRTWESYQSVRQSGSSAAMARGIEHQKRVDTSMTADYPDNKQDPIIRIEEEFLTEGNVGMSKKPDPTLGEVKFADQTIVDRLTGEVTTVSNKSRHFEQILQDPLDARQWNEIKEIVRKDAQELYDKYAGDIYIRRPTHPFYNQKKTVTEIILVYDGDPSLINRELSEYITREADNMIAELNKGNDAITVDLIVTFQYE